MAAAINLRLPPRVVDSDALPKTAAEELARLVAAAKAAPAATEEKPGRGADAMAYTITIEEDGTRTVLKRSDTAMSALARARDFPRYNPSGIDDYSPLVAPAPASRLHLPVRFMLASFIAGAGVV